MNRAVDGRYEPAQNIVHLWFPSPVYLRDDRTTAEFFEEVVAWLEKVPGTFYLLVDYANLRISPNVLAAYAAQTERFQPRLLGTFRYGINNDFTGVAVTLGNLRRGRAVELYPDEAAAREAIRAARA